MALGFAIGFASLIMTAYAAKSVSSQFASPVIPVFAYKVNLRLYQLFLTQGLLYGLCQAMVVPLVLSLPSQHFQRNRALATGCVGSFAGWGGGALALATHALLRHFKSTRIPLCIFAGTYAVTWIAGFILIDESKERKQAIQLARIKLQGMPDVSATPVEGILAPEARSRRLPKAKSMNIDLGGIARTSLYWTLSASIFISSFAYLAPYQYITTYTQEHFPTTSSVWPLVSMNFGLGFGRILAGVLADRVLGPVQTLGICLIVAGLLQIIVWHLATTYAVTIVFAVLYGVFGGIAQSLVPAIVMQLFPAARTRFAFTVGTLMVQTAPGQLTGASVAGAVLNRSGSWFAFQGFAGGLQIVGGLFAVWTWYASQDGLHFGVKDQRVVRAESQK